MSALPTVGMGAGYDREERKKKEEPRVSVCEYFGPGIQKKSHFYFKLGCLPVGFCNDCPPALSNRNLMKIYARQNYPERIKYTHGCWKVFVGCISKQQGSKYLGSGEQF